MRRLAVALASLGVMSFAPPAAQTSTIERDVSCLGVMGFAAASLDEDEPHVQPLRIYFAYFLGRLNAREPGQPWADRSVASLKKMDVEQIKSALLVCASVADQDFESAIQPAADSR